MSITTNPTVANGEPCIRDTGITVKQIKNLLVHNSDAQIIESYPALTKEDIAVVRFGNITKITQVEPVFYTAEDMKKAYGVLPSIPSSEWLKEYDLGNIVHPQPIQVVKKVEEFKDGQNLPKENNLQEEGKSVPKADVILALGVEEKKPATKKLANKKK